MRIRRYYGFDCDSVMGFNNGSYIDDEPIKVDNHDEAFELCKQALAERWDLSQFSDDDIENLDDAGIQLITGYFNEHGELTRKEYLAIDDPDGTKTHYSYVFVNFEIVEE